MACDLGRYVTACQITDESIAASFGVSEPEIKARMARRSLREQRREARLKAEEERVARHFARAIRDAEIRELTGLDTLRECARLFGLSYERIRQIQQRKIEE